MIKEAKEYAENHTTLELLQYMDATIEGNVPTCMDDIDPLDAINILAKSIFIRKLMDNGSTINEATRELGLRMRNVIEEQLT